VRNSEKLGVEVDQGVGGGILGERVVLICRVGWGSEVLFWKQGLEGYDVWR